MSETGLQRPSSGSYNSADARHAVPQPPIARSLPSSSKLAVKLERPVTMRSIGVHVLEVGSYTSAEAIGSPDASTPPATSTFPLSNRTEMCRARSVAIAFELVDQ